MRRPEADLGALEHRLGHVFADGALLRRAMAHRSWCAEQPGVVHSNERLEFLGDAVLGWVVADLAYHRHGELAEGKLTDLRKSIVNASALAAVAQELGIGAYLLLGKGEDAAGGRTKPSILSDAMEAVIGAVYIDGGTEAAYGLIERLVGDRLTSSASLLDHLDYKTASAGAAVRACSNVRRCTCCVRRAPTTPSTSLPRSRWTVGSSAKAKGRSKKQAEQVAARMACEHLRAAAIDGDAVVASG